MRRRRAWLARGQQGGGFGPSGHATGSLAPGLRANYSGEAAGQGAAHRLQLPGL